MKAKRLFVVAFFVLSVAMLSYPHSLTNVESRVIVGKSKIGMARLSH